MNLALWLARSAQVHGMRPAVALGLRNALDYTAFADAAARTASGLRALGVTPGDRVGLFMANAPDYLVAMWGAWWAGAVVVPVNARLHGRETAWILGHSGARCCFVDVAHRDELAPHAADGLVLLSDLQTLQAHAPLAAARADRSEDDPAWLFYTSGTTGRPKGVTLTMRNLRWATMAYVSRCSRWRPATAACTRRRCRTAAACTTCPT